jgi:hypothetical protein
MRVVNWEIPVHKMIWLQDEKEENNWEIKV